ncbi:alpha/beta fold hydrolase [Actinomadura sp. LD22]|uniref:Alpha/beta fold hydrolase n=1 Tax=Actinomadura physcomitrii TaxID=2650748 RepID=A0A6I4MGX2_9ACTN|nr:alpha/beta hydrolase [Actinomadura physcomitrii]MWA04140.1 alpha/beta fold hydrolase [Actinomadura physcomitrii]
MTRGAMPADEGTVPVDGADLRWARLGDGARTVIAAHQGPGGPSRPPWLRLLAETPGVNVLSLELRGTDGAPHEDLGDGWYPRWALDVARAAEALSEADYVYAGASHGAVVGWHLALDRPPGLRALVSVVGAPHGRDGGPAAASGWERRKAAARDRRLAEEVFASMRPPTSDPVRLRRRAEARESYLKGLDALDPGALPRVGIALPHLRTDAEVADTLRTIDVPVLVTGGIQDRLCRPEDNLRAAAAVPGARLVLFQDHGHTTLLDEEPEPLIEQIRLFLARIGPQPTPEDRRGDEEGSPCL